MIGTGLGALAHYFLSARGPLHGVPQMVLGRMAFGFKGNAVPVGADVGDGGCRAGSRPTASAARSRCRRCSASGRWSGLDHHRAAADRVRVLRAQPGAGLREVVLPGARRSSSSSRRWRSSCTPTSASPAPPEGVGGMGGFLLTVGTAFGYAAGWTPYAADYTRYLPSTVSTAAHRAVRLGRAVRLVRGAGDRRCGIGHHRCGASSADPTGSFTCELASPLGEGDAAGHRDRGHRRQLDQHLFRRNGFRDDRDQAARPHRARAGHGVLRRRRLPGRVVGAARRRRTATRRSC